MSDTPKKWAGSAATEPARTYKNPMTYTIQRFAHNQPLPPYIEDIGPCPKSGAGVHRWLFTAARKLHRHYGPEVIFEILKDRAKGCGRVVPDREVRDAVVNSARGRSDARFGSGCLGGEVPRKEHWPEVDLVAVQRVVSSMVRPLERLAKGSNWGGLPKTLPECVWSIVGTLFPGDPLICAGGSVGAMRCQHVSEWGTALSETQLIVPSPMTARTGVNLEGRDSTRCLGNTGLRRFLVAEFDNLAIEDQAAIHIHLSRRYPLALVVHSGGKSLHGWFYVANEEEGRVREFMRHAVNLGADPHTWTRCQAVRTPGGLRRDGGQVRLQEVVYFNPNYAA